MNLVIKTDAGNFTMENVKKIQEIDGNLHITVLKSKNSSKQVWSVITKLLDYINIKSSISEYQSSIDVIVKVSPKMKIELITKQI